MGGAASGRVTSAAGGVDGTTVGATGGGQTYTMQRSDLPNVAPTFTGSAGTVSVTSSNTAVGGAIAGGVSSGSGGLDGVSSALQITILSSGTFTPIGTVQSLNGGVTQTAMKTIPPAIIVPYLIRII
jgi:microcystin-dependent protein